MKKLLLVLLFSYSIVGIAEEYIDVKFQRIKFDRLDMASGLGAAIKMCNSKGYDTALFHDIEHDNCIQYGDGLFGSNKCLVTETKKTYVCLNEV